MGEAKLRRELGLGPRGIKVKRPSAASMKNMKDGKLDVRVEFHDVPPVEPREDGVVVMARLVLNEEPWDWIGYKEPLSAEQRARVAFDLVESLKQTLVQGGVTIKGSTMLQAEPTGTPLEQLIMSESDAAEETSASGG